MNDHLGDALWRVGREREARFQWDQSLTLSPEPDDADKIRKKLTKGLPTQAQAAKKAARWSRPPGEKAHCHQVGAGAGAITRPMPAADANVMTEFARPKVNLTLRVLGKRPDGYHALESLVAFARKPADLLTLHPGDAAGVTVSGPGASAILGENLIARALRLLVDAEPRLRLGALHLEKHLPVAAGIGGGSADAAAVLRLVRRAKSGHRKLGRLASGRAEARR